MKVALADAELFVSPVQPARRLMDRIASTAVGWLPEGEENVRYLAEVNRAINTVLVAINEGPAIFEKALDEFEKYLSEERVRDDDPVTRAKRALEEAETREIMAINAAIGIRRAFDGVQIESYLRDFLLEVWVKVLVAATLRERTQADFARKFRDAVSDLIWSVQPKINPDDRKRLVKTIPAVLNTLREGLQLIELPSAQMQEFFGKLMASHAQAVKALEVAYGTGAPLDQNAIRRRIDEVKIEEPPPAQPDEPMQQLTITAEVVRSAVAANHAEVNVLEEALTVAPEEMIPVEELSDDAIDAMIEGWQRGSWFDLWTGQQTERGAPALGQPASQLLSLHVGRDRQGAFAGAAVPARLRSRRPHQSAEKTPLFERVVGDLMRDLQGERTAVAAYASRAGTRRGDSVARRRRKSSGVTLSEEDGMRYLHFGTEWIQGGMRIARPYALELAYQQQMMAPGLFLPEPGRIVQLGLGAAALTKFCHRHVPSAEVVVVELSEQVIEAARGWFLLPDDDARLTVVHDDAKDFIAQPRQRRRADWLQVDLYDAHARGPVYDDTTSTGSAGRRWRSPVSRASTCSDAASTRASNASAGRSTTVRWLLPEVDEGNRVVLAFVGPPLAVTLSALLARASELEARWRLPARGWVSGLRTANGLVDRLSI